MDKKILMMGIGIGLILSSSIFYISYTFNKNATPQIVVNKETSQNDVEDNLEDIITPPPSPLPTDINESIDDAPPTDVVEGIEDVTEDNVEINLNDEDHIINDVDEDIEADEEIEVDEDVEVNYIPFTIEPGSPSNVIINNLYANGIIDDVDAYTDYITEDTKQKLRYGKYKIPENASYEEITNILINAN